jgi:hypothetical protein
MTIELTMGCVCDAFEADGMPMQAKSLEELKNIVDAQLKNVRQSNDFNALYNLSMYITETFYDEYETSEQCECCGDYVETYKQTI